MAVDLPSRDLYFIMMHHHHPPLPLTPDDFDNLEDLELNFELDQALAIDQELFSCAPTTPIPALKISQIMDIVRRVDDKVKRDQIETKARTESFDVSRTCHGAEAVRVREAYLHLLQEHQHQHQQQTSCPPPSFDPMKEELIAREIAQASGYGEPDAAFWDSWNLFIYYQSEGHGLHFWEKFILEEV